MKKFHIDKLTFAVLIIFVLLLNNLQITKATDPTVPGIDDATQSAFKYLKTKFGTEYFNQNIVYLETMRISHDAALGMPTSTDGTSGNYGIIVVGKNNTFNSNPSNQGNSNIALNHYLVRFKHTAKIDNKNYEIGFIDVYLDSNYYLVRSFGVLNCAEIPDSCKYKISEDDAYKITSNNVQFKTSRKTAQLTYNGEYDKIVWIISLYPENENGFGKSIMIDSFDGAILQNNNFIKSSYAYYQENSSNATINTVESKKPNAFQRFFEWLGSLFK